MIKITVKALHTSALSVPILIQTLVSRSAFIFILLSTVLLAPGCTRLFFKLSKEIVMNTARLKYSPSDVYFKSSDGLTLHGWYFRAKEERGAILNLP